MSKKIILLSISIVLIFLCGCGSNTALTKFKSEIDVFCTNVSTIDNSMNKIDATSMEAKDEILNYLDQLDAQFLSFADMDFPKEFDYLEHLADEASQYMKEAVSYYHKAFEGENGYDDSYVEYAFENYSRALKRVQIIITFLHGEKPENVNLEIEY